MRVFPLSNWTELDIWQYINKENIQIPDLYLSRKRPVVERDGVLIMVDDDRLPLNEGEVPMQKKVRFRTLGCYPLTGAVESAADTLPEVIQEMLLTTTSERQGRVIDSDVGASMEQKKRRGVFLMSHHDALIKTDILGYLKAQENKSFLRFITCGSVDDGKSTLIGRLLYDSKLIYEDQLAAIEKDSKKSGTQGEKVDLALFG